jgi:hypothetical protein
MNETKRDGRRERQLQSVGEWMTVVAVTVMLGSGVFATVWARSEPAAATVRRNCGLYRFGMPDSSRPPDAREQVAYDAYDGVWFDGPAIDPGRVTDIRLRAVGWAPNERVELRFAVDDLRPRDYCRLALVWQGFVVGTAKPGPVRGQWVVEGLKNDLFAALFERILRGDCTWPDLRDVEGETGPP